MSLLLLFALLGGIVALDNVSAVQSMISRPLPAAFLAGTVLGVPVEAAAVGAFLELYMLVAVPAGGGRMPEGGSAALASAVTVSLAPGAAGLALGTAAGLLWGVVASWSQTGLRRMNGERVPIPGESAISARAVGLALAGGIVRDFSRGALLAVAAWALAHLVVPVLAPTWPLDGSQTSGLLMVGGMVSLGVLLRAEDHPRRAFLLFGLGLALGTAAGGGLPWP